ncbi:HTH-type transcriptional activator AmpR (plasmid) [Hartmannibacter diazotrophicus]|uniref:HTH-type transcriptional activator AmpR n=1 Tax=Hartmannibacter diazotrophicus TaxID=1482074 RepID=A0A2C9DEE1_9HYPH|nr:LysR substrate-binding domain-containing protein [Hartmannibacter diazotrophicus]SON58451.1 HTH-type transcriptional activator AmpR [Hartmannibacter diazotrophicus]
MKNIPVGSLRVFEAAARSGSFRLAGEELGISPSAVSHAVRKLEDQVGTELFVREGRSVRLNPGGETLLRHVSSAFNQMRHGLEIVGARSDALLRLHCAPSMAAQWLMPRLPVLMANMPGLKVRLSASTDYPRFHNDEFDLDIRYGPPRQEGLIAIPLGEEIVTPLCRPEMAGDIRDPMDLFELPLIESEHKQVRWSDWFAVNGLPPPPPGDSRFDRSFMAISAAADGMGIALESTRLAEREIASGRLVAPLTNVARDATYIGHFLVYPPTASPRRSVRAFSDWLSSELALPPVSHA